jgi:hypothetical protein
VTERNVTAKTRGAHRMSKKVPNGRLQRLDPEEIGFWDFAFRVKKSLK